MSLLDLRCTPGETSGFCLNGGVCERDISLGVENAFHRCICPEGVLHDFTISHSENCGIGSSQERLAVFVVLTLVFWFTIGYLVYLAQYHARARVRRNVYLRTSYIFFTFLNIMCIFVQGGSFFASFAFQLISQNLLIHIVFDMAKLGDTAFDTTSAERLRRITLGLECFLLFEQTATAIPVLVTAGWSAHPGDPFSFNLTFIIMCSCQAVSGIVGFGLLIHQYKKLAEFIRNLSKHNVSSPQSVKRKQNDLLQRIESSIKQGRITIITLCAVMIIPILFISMGSIPGQLWIWFFFMLSIPFGVFQGARKLVSSTESGSNQPSSTDGNSVSEPSTPRRAALGQSQSAITISAQNMDTSIRVTPAISVDSNPVPLTSDNVLTSDPHPEPLPNVMGPEVLIPNSSSDSSTIVPILQHDSVDSTPVSTEII